MHALLWIVQALGSPALASEDVEVGAAEPPRAEQNRRDRARGKAKSKQSGKPPTNRKPTDGSHDKPPAQPVAATGPGGKDKPGQRPTEKPSQGPTHGPDARRPDSQEGRVAERTDRSTNRPTTVPADRRAANPREVRSTAREHVAVHPRPVARDVHVTNVHLHYGHDHRWARPHPYVVHMHPHHPHPHYVWYRPRWTHWWVHPYWRWAHATTVVVAYSYTPDPWADAWAPPARDGWVWVGGYYAGATWVPGYWRPVETQPTWYGAEWVWVPGWWMGPTWVEGHWRLQSRNGWVWVDGYYLEDGSYVRGWWEPASGAPTPGYVWEAGHWDGEFWVEGFWRPDSRDDYRWVDASLDADSGIYYAGYWEPADQQTGSVWIPGWFDGDQWNEGEWVSQAEYDKADPENWQPEAGWDEQPPENSVALPTDEELPPALPYTGPPGGAG